MGVLCFPGTHMAPLSPPDCIDDASSGMQYVVRPERLQLPLPETFRHLRMVCACAATLVHLSAGRRRLDYKNLHEVQAGGRECLGRHSGRT